jgi:hypothetical protein
MNMSNKNNSNYADAFEQFAVNSLNNKLIQGYNFNNIHSDFRTKIISKSDKTLKNNLSVAEIVKKVGTYRRVDAICDALEIDSSEHVKALFEIKCHRLIQSRSAVGDMLCRIRTGNSSIESQWQSLTKTGLPYGILIGYHDLTHDECLSGKLKYDEMYIVCLLGKSDKFTIIQGDLKTFNWDLSADIINRRLDTSATYNRQDVVSLAENEDEDLFWIDNQSRLKEKLCEISIKGCSSKISTKYTVTESGSIFEIPDLNKIILDKFLSGQRTAQIAEDLNKRGYKQLDGNQLTSAYISGRLPPTATAKYNFSKHAEEIRSAFYNALANNGSDNCNRFTTAEVRHLSSFLKTIVHREYKNTAVRRWFFYHPQAELFMRLRKQAIADYQSNNNLFASESNDIVHQSNEVEESYQQSDEILILKQKVSALEEAVHIILDIVNKGRS